MTEPKPPRRPRYAGTHPQRFDERYKERDPARYPEIVEHVRARGATPAGSHVPVMRAEVLAALRPQPSEVVVDLTVGHGGHAAAFLQALEGRGTLLAVDLDRRELARTAELLGEAAGGTALVVRHGSFAGLAKYLAEAGLEGADVVFADLGVSSMQLDDPLRGFSYKHDGPLDMRLDPDRATRNAAALLATLSGDQLAEALRELSDEPDADAIAAAIERTRRAHPIETTGALVDLVLDVKGLDRARVRAMREAGQTHPAARTFQALRILVNDELAALDHLLRTLPGCLRPGGRAGILSFHSGEDRRVKQAFKEGVRNGFFAEVAPDPARPTPEEVRDNPRAAPARFRWALRAT